MSDFELKMYRDLTEWVAKLNPDEDLDKDDVKWLIADARARLGWKLPESVRDHLMKNVEDVNSEMEDGIHTIPIPQGWSIEQAWEAIRRDDFIPDLSDDEYRWVVIEVRDNKLERVLRAESVEINGEEYD